MHCLKEFLKSWGLVGIGGKRSGGYGKFELADDPIELSEEGIYSDDSALYTLLHNVQGKVMCISACVPTSEEVLILKEVFINYKNEVAL